MRLALIGIALCALASTTSALATPAEKSVSCPQVIAESAIKEKIDRGELSPTVRTAIPTTLLNGQLYCTADMVQKPGAGMFGGFTNVIRLHERGKIEDTSYRADYYRGWVEVFLDERSKPDRRNAGGIGADKQDYQPDILCRYDPYGSSHVENIDDKLTDAVTCALFADDQGTAIFYFTDHSNGVTITDRFDGDKSGAIKASPTDEPLSVPVVSRGWFSMPSYQLAFGKTLSPRKMLSRPDSDPVVANLISAIYESESFLINAGSGSDYETISSKRIQRALPLLIAIAGRMAPAD